MLFTTTLAINHAGIMTFGDVAEGLSGGIFALKGVIQAVCILTGVGFVAGGLGQYVSYRQRKGGVKLSNAVFLFLLGVGIIAVAFIPMY